MVGESTPKTVHYTFFVLSIVYNTHESHFAVLQINVITAHFYRRGTTRWASSVSSLCGALAARDETIQLGRFLDVMVSMRAGDHDAKGELLRRIGTDWTGRSHQDHWALPRRGPPWRSSRKVRFDTEMSYGCCILELAAQGRVVGFCDICTSKKTSILFILTLSRSITIFYWLPVHMSSADRLKNIA